MRWEAFLTVCVHSVPVTRPLTPEIDPPAPTMEAWKQRLMG
jgi:hypothetical protein